MLVRCLLNSGADLPPDPAYGPGYTASTRFEVTVGERYQVYGILMFKRGLTVLLRDDTGKPNWHPVELFEVADGRLPDAWKFATRDDGELGAQAIFGYSELVDNEGHLEALVERESAALRVFLAQVADRD